MKPKVIFVASGVFGMVLLVGVIVVWLCFRNGPQALPNPATAISTAELLPSIQVDKAKQPLSAITIDEVRSFAGVFVDRLREDSHGGAANIVEADLRRCDSVLHPVIGQFRFEFTQMYKSDDEKYSRITMESIDLSVAKMDGYWELVDGTVEVVSEFQIPKLLPSSEGKKTKATADPRLGLVFIELKGIEMEKRK